jgi:hypothetical protein
VKSPDGAVIPSDVDQRTEPTLLALVLCAATRYTESHRPIMIQSRERWLR